MNLPIRLSPSGPILANENGAPFVPGPGARLRLVEAYGTCGSNPIPTVPAVIGDPIGQPGFELHIDAPKQLLQYRATAVCEVRNPTTNETQSVQLYWDTSIDAVTWVNQSSNTHQVEAGTTRLIRHDLPLLAGAAYGVTTNAARLYARCRIGAADGGGSVSLVSEIAPGASGPTSKGTIDLQLEECF